MTSSLRPTSVLGPRPVTLVRTPSPKPPVQGISSQLNAPTNSEIEQVIQMATAARPGSGGRSPTGRDTRTQLFVGNLPYRVRWQDLKDLFRKAGTVLRADVSLGPDNRSRGYGTVLMASAEDAGRAVDMFNGYSWQSRTLEVRPDRLPPDFDAMNNANHSVNGHNSAFAIPSPLHAMPYMPPPPPSAPLLGGMMDSDELGVRGGRPRAESLGFSAPTSFGLPPMPMANPNFLRAANATPSGRNLYVGNLPFHCQWQDLKDLFRRAGTVTRADVALGPDGRSRGYGTVVFSNEIDADRAVKMFNGYEYNGRVLKVHYDKYSQAIAAQPLVPNIPPSSPPVSAHSSTSLLQQQIRPPTEIPLPPPPQTFNLASGPTSPVETHATPFYLPSLGSLPAFPPPPAPSYAPAQNDHGPGSPFAPFPPFPTSPPRHPSSPPAVPPSNHPAHPGPITLPSHPPGFQSPTSPLLTHLGLPPITPSMPSFTFLPQSATPPLHAQFLSPGIGPFSPTLNSPPGFYRPVNPFLNPAPGAPVHMQPSTGNSTPGGYYSMHPVASEPSGYFEGAIPPSGSGYFGLFHTQPPPASTKESADGWIEGTGRPGEEPSELGLIGRGSSPGTSVTLGSSEPTPDVFEGNGLGLDGFKSLTIDDKSSHTTPLASESGAVLGVNTNPIPRAKSTTPHSIAMAAPSLSADAALPTQSSLGLKNGNGSSFGNGSFNGSLSDEGPLSVRRASWNEAARSRPKNGDLEASDK